MFLSQIFKRSKPVLVVAPKRKRGRPTREQAAERRKIAIAEAKTRLELAQLQQQLQKLESGASNESGSDIDELLKLVGKVEKLKKSGILGAEASGDTFDRLVERLPDLVHGLAPIVAAAQQRQAQATPPPPALPPVAAPQQPVPAPAAQPVQAEPSWVVGYIKSQLANRDPESAAAWIQAQDHPFAPEMVQLVRTTQDSRVFAVLDDQARQVPEFAPLVDWLKARGEWTLQVCAHLRQPVDAVPVENAASIF